MEQQPFSESRALEGEKGGELEGREEEGEGGGGGEGWGTGDREDWIQGKSHMLDEVNQIVELMSAEKASLQDKISALEVEVDQYHRQTQEIQEGMRKKEEDVSRMKLEHSAQEDKHAMEQQTLHRALYETREQLKSVREESNLLTESLEQEKRCHSEARTKLEVLQEQYKTLSQALKQNNMENEKLKAQVSSLQEQANGYRSEKDALRSQLETEKLRHRKSRDEVLALRGRLSSCRKTQEQLHVHCSTLERAVQSSAHASVSKTTRRSKEEARLAKECRKKDELLSSYLQEISTCHDEHKRIQEEMIQLQKRLSQEQAEKRSLSNRLEESVTKNYQLQHQLQEAERRIHFREQQDCKAGTLWSALEERLEEVSEQLEQSQREHDRLREEMRVREQREREERRRRVRERQRNETMVKESSEAMEQLQRELEATIEKHRTEMEAMDKQWQRRLSEAQGDYERLKEASMRRCVELAKEVWQLKSSLESSHDQQ